MNPISVVLTYYNETSYVGEALASVMRQTHPQVELIVVDDGAEVPLDTLLDTSGFTLLRQDNGGDGAARNAGLRLASHDLIAFIDADDIWPENRLAQLDRALIGYPDAAISYGMVEQFVSPELPDSVKRSLHCPPDAIAGYAPTGMLIRKNLFDQVGMFVEDRKLHSSLAWLSRVKAVGPPEVRVEDIVLRRRLHETNMSREIERKNTRMLRSLRQKIQRSRQEN